MSSADEIKRAFKDAELSVNPDADEKVLEDVLGARQKITKKVPVMPDNIWRIFMKNPLAKIAVAAVVTIACVTGLFMWTGTGSGIALADVLNRIEQISVYMYQMSMSMSGQVVADQPIDQEMHTTILVSHDYGMKMITEMSSPVGGENIQQEMYMLPQKKAVIMLMPSQKTYMQMDLDDKMVEQTQQQNNDPRLMIKRILECEYESLGISAIDGIEVEGFQTSDPNYLGGMMGQVDVKIWVDVVTQLPVRSEMDMQMNEIQMHAVMHDFQWDVTVDATEFEPVIPEDYTTLAGGPIKMPAFDEQTAVRGLELFAEMTGAYPEELDLMNIISKTSEVMGRKLVEERQQQENQDISEQERTRELTEKIMPITGLVAFYMQLVQNKNDPAYYGETVTPEDVDKVLMRWKVSDNEYRVIFGDLQAETVDVEVLAELESTLPQ